MLASLKRRVAGLAGQREDEDVRDYCRIRAAAQATLERTEEIIEELATAVRWRLPRVQHVTLEVEGIATVPGAEPGISG